MRRILAIWMLVCCLCSLCVMAAAEPTEELPQEDELAAEEQVEEQTEEQTEETAETEDNEIEKE